MQKVWHSEARSVPEANRSQQNSLLVCFSSVTVPCPSVVSKRQRIKSRLYIIYRLRQLSHVGTALVHTNTHHSTLAHRHTHSTDSVSACLVFVTPARIDPVQSTKIKQHNWTKEASFTCSHWISPFRVQFGNPQMAWGVRVLPLCLFTRWRSAGENHVGHTPAFDLSFADDTREHLVCVGLSGKLTGAPCFDFGMNASLKWLLRPFSIDTDNEVLLFPLQNKIFTYLRVKQLLATLSTHDFSLIEKGVNICMQTITCTRSEVISERTASVDSGRWCEV